MEVEYADVARRDLSDLGFPSDLSGDAVSVVEGTARDLRLWDGGIRFITPGDPGYDTRVTLRVDLADRTVDMPVRIRSLRPTTISHESEVDEFGNFPHPSPPLRVKGLGPGNALLGGELSFSIEGSPPLDPRASGATAYDQDDKRLYDLADLWSYDPMANALTLSAESVETLVARLPSAEFIFSIGMSGEDADFNHVYTLLAHKPVASVSGQVVDGQGRVQTQLLGREVALRGLGNNGTRRVATIDARGEFSFPHVIQGMYFVVLLDPFLPDAWMTTLSVRPGSRHEEVSLVLQPVGNIYPAPVNADRLKPLSVSNAEAGEGSVVPSCSSPDKDGVIFRVAAGAEEQDIPCEVAFVLPKGTQRAGVRVSVTTAEFPEYTTVKSTFNDTWSYKLTGLLKEISNSGRVNVTHAHQGTVRKTYCIDVSGLTRSADSKVSGLLNARNVGDGMLPTAVILRIAPQCDDMLRVTVANMKSPNVKGFHTNRPLNSQKKGGPYLSVPLMSAVTDWGMPVDMKFEPADTQLKKARIGLLRGDILHMSDVDVLDKGYLVGKGHFRFKDLIIPVFGIERFNGTAQLVMELTGEREGKKLTSIPEDDEPVIFNGGASNLSLIHI